MIKHVTKVAVAGALLAGALATEASANGSVFPATAQTGETAGLARGAPLPEGVYFVNTLSWGHRKGPGVNPGVDLLVEIPVIAWSTPWSIFGANLQILGALPMAHAGVHGPGGDSFHGLYNPFAGATLAYDFGGGFGASYTSGIYFNTGDKRVAINATTWRQDFAISYTGDGWNLTANLIWGITFDSDNRCRILGVQSCNGKTNNGFNLDLTATKTFGKWEIGAVGFGSRTYDEANIVGTNIKQPRYKQFAVGPLVGYNFGPVILQAFLTRDVYARNTSGNRGGKETRFWSRAIIPLWTPEAPAAPLVTKY